MRNSNVSTWRMVRGIYSGIVPDSGLILVIFVEPFIDEISITYKIRKHQNLLSSLKRVISGKTFITGLRLNT